MILHGTILSAAAPERLDSFERGYLVTDEAGRIEYVGATLPPCYAGLPVTGDGSGLILQSFADMHLHGPQYPMVGLGMDLPLMDWLSTYTFKNEVRFAEADFARQCYRQLAAELVRCGTTRVAMFSSLHTDATLILMEELERAGLCGCVGKVNMDRNCPGLQETNEESMRETLRWLDGCGRFRRVRPILTPRFTPACSDALMVFLGGLARERGLPVQSHLSENLQEIGFVRELSPDCGQYFETYKKAGLWNGRTIMAHCVHSDERERAAIREAGVLVAHCPDSNINICSGFAPVKQMLREGLRVALGSDIAGGASLRMTDVMTAAIRTSKARRIVSGWEEEFLTVPEAYYLATSAGHGWFGDRPGFAVGNPLHAILADDSVLPLPARPLTPTERLERLLYRGDDRCFTAVFSDGQKIR